MRKDVIESIILPSRFLLVDAQYEQAMAVDCPFCGAKKGDRCRKSLVFPQYPHTSRIEASLQMPEGSWEYVVFESSEEDKKKERK